MLRVAGPQLPGARARPEALWEAPRQKRETLSQLWLVLVGGERRPVVEWGLKLGDAYDVKTTEDSGFLSIGAGIKYFGQRIRNTLWSV